MYIQNRVTDQINSPRKLKQKAEIESKKEKKNRLMLEFQNEKKKQTKIM